MTNEMDLLRSLKRHIDCGQIDVRESSNEYFAKLAQYFPALGSKIDWEKLSDSMQRIACDSDYLRSCREFFDEVRELKDLNGPVIVIGDSQIDSALLMSMETLSDCLESILIVPQHHYIVGEDFSWCMVFAMEGEMAFGRRP